MRGAAALAVAVFHFQRSALPGGYLAVDFFFLLSGFVLERTYGARLGNDIGFARFAAIRAIRLLPVHMIGVVLGAGLLGIATLRHWDGAMAFPAIARSFAFNIFLIPDPFHPVLFPINLPAWSLFVEMLASLALAWFLAKLSQRRLALVCLLSFIALVAEGLIRSAPSNDSSTIALGHVWDGSEVGLFRAAFSFTLGLLVARNSRHQPRKQTAWAVAIVVVLVAVMAMPLTTQTRLWFDLACVSLVFPLLLLVGSRIEPRRYLAPLATLAGEVSYPLYIVHYGFIRIGWYIFERRLAWSAFATCAANLVLSLTLAWLITRFIDPRIRRALTLRFLPRAAIARTAPEATVSA